MRSTVLVAVAALVSALGCGGLPLDTGAVPDGVDVTALAALYSAPAGPVVLDGTEPALGEADAPYLIVVFSDFSCLYCQTAHRALMRLVTENPDVQARFVAYPLSSDCNPAVAVPGKSTSCPTN